MSKIEWLNHPSEYWTPATWNPVAGCSPVSAGCDNCYAARMARRLASMTERETIVNDETCITPKFPKYQGLVDPETQHWTGEVGFCEKELEKPLLWRKPRLCFPCSMGDLFYEGVSAMLRNRIFDVMHQAKAHRFLMLTKRPWYHSVCHFGKNMGLGVSISNQRVRGALTILQRARAPFRFVSCEPLLGPLDLRPYLDMLDWVIVGAETGPGARVMDPKWVWDIFNHCKQFEVPFFFKKPGKMSIDSAEEIRIIQIREWPAWLEASK